MRVWDMGKISWGKRTLHAARLDLFARKEEEIWALETRAGESYGMELRMSLTIRSASSP